MKKRIVWMITALLLIALALVSAGCQSGKINMLTGRWKLISTGTGNGGNQQQPFFPMAFDVYPNGTVDMVLGGTGELFGKWTMDRDTFTFKSEDGDLDVAGGFKVNPEQDPQTGGNVLILTILPDDVDASYKLQKISDLGPLESAKRAQAAASAQPAPAQSPAPEATAAANAQ